MKPLGQQIAELQAEITALKQQLSEVSHQLKVQGEILQVAQNNEFWMSTTQASKFLKASEHALRKRISRAEQQRLEGTSPNLCRGIHYRHKGMDDAVRHTWEINVKTWPANY
jgi:hypothetical protein